jgi:hypothetical protein
MAANINKVTSIPGVVAFQDHSDKNQFFYMPQRVACVLGETLKDFKVEYWGIAKPFYASTTGGRIIETSGAVLAGVATCDITRIQRTELLQQIRTDFPDSKTPRIAPIILKNSVVTPVLAQKTLSLGQDSDITFPSTITFGSDFNYLVGTGNALFGSFVAAQQDGPGVTPNPMFGLNVVGEVEVRGEPWKASITCDLSSVYNYVRSKVSGEAKFGWFTLGSSEVTNIVQDLDKKKIITLSFEQGSLDLEKFGAQVFELAKRLFEEINKLASAGDGYFRFEPNPTAPTSLASPSKALGFLGFGLSINASHVSIKSTQTTKFEQTISFVGNFLSKQAMGVTLAVNCSGETRKLFVELGIAEPCVTTSKIDSLRERLQKEKAKKDEKLAELYQALLEGRIDIDKFDKLRKILEEMSLASGLTEVKVSRSRKRVPTAGFTMGAEIEIADLIETLE